MTTLSLWNYFEVVKTEPRYIRCTLCGKNLSRGSEIKKHERKEFLENHLQDKHSELLSKVFDSKKLFGKQKIKAEKLISSTSHLNQNIDTEEAPLYFNNSTNGGNKLIGSRAVGRSVLLPVLLRGHNLLPFVEIGLTDLRKSGDANPGTPRDNTPETHVAAANFYNKIFKYIVSS